MYLIYVCAKHPKNKLPETAKLPQDIEPLLLGVHCKKESYFLRDASTKKEDIPKPKGYEHVERIFVRLNQAEDDNDENGSSLCDAFEEGEAQLAVALATVLFQKGKVEPTQQEFVEYVIARSRIADRLVIAGYTDKKCDLSTSEKIAHERATEVKRLLVENGLCIPVITISRPASSYAASAKYSRRVEITALFFSGNKNFGSDDDSGSSPKPAPKPTKSKKSKPKTKKTQVKATKKIKPKKELEPVATAKYLEEIEFNTPFVKEIY